MTHEQAKRIVDDLTYAEKLRLYEMLLKIKKSEREKTE